ncbi:MAG: hypothetical protein RSF67_03530, partial [Clostridia bacterium]
MNNELRQIVDIICTESKDNLKCIILGGSRGKGNEIIGWSDYDIYIINHYLEINTIKKIQVELLNKIAKTILQKHVKT